jgi:hypothetical protein
MLGHFSRTVTKDENEDQGEDIEFETEKSSDLSGGQNDGTVHSDAKPDFRFLTSEMLGRQLPVFTLLL